MNGQSSVQAKARRVGSPAPKAYKMLGSDRVVIEALCPEVAMTHFAFGNFRREEADDVRVVHCPICGQKHALMWPAAWVSGGVRSSFFGFQGPPRQEDRSR